MQNTENKEIWTALYARLSMDDGNVGESMSNGTQNQICCLVGNEIAEDVQLSEIHKKVWLLFFRVLQVSAFSG